MELKREIKRWDLVLLMINSIIGAGIFGLPSKIYNLSGIYSLLALFCCAIFVFILVLNFAEVASRFDKTGGPYLYTLKAFGKVPAFIMGWLILITRISTYAALVNLIVTYLSFFNPLFLETAYRFTTIIFITLILTYVNYRGVKTSTIVNNTLSISKLLPLTLFIIVGLFFIEPDLLVKKTTFPAIGEFTSSIFILIFAFTGFESVLVNSGEVQNPKKNIPFALIISVLFVALFYSLIQFVSIGTLPNLATSDKPLTDATQLFMGPIGATIITIGAVISTMGTLNSVMLIGSRLPYALSEENQFPSIFKKLESKYSTPIYSLIIFSSITLIASLTGSFIYAVSISVISKVFIFLMVCASLIKLRMLDTSDTNYYKLPFGKIFAGIGIILSIALLYSSKTEDFIDVIYTVAIGLILYVIFKVIKSIKF